jgi:hypothetical protein
MLPAIDQDENKGRSGHKANIQATQGKECFDAASAIVSVLKTPKEGYKAPTQKQTGHFRKLSTAL